MQSPAGRAGGAFDFGFEALAGVVLADDDDNDSLVFTFHATQSITLTCSGSSGRRRLPA